MASREGCFETVNVLLDHYANRDITDNMDRLPRDVALEHHHHHIVDLLDNYKVISPAALHFNSTSSPNHTAAVGLCGYAQPVKQKSRSRKSKNGPAKCRSSFSPQSRVSESHVPNRQVKARKKKGDGENEPSSKVNLQQHDQHIPASSSSQNHLQLSQQLNSDSSPMSAVSPGSYSTDSHHSPQRFETSPRYESSQLLLPSDLGDGSHHMEDFQILTGHYNSPALIEHTDVENLLAEWTIPQGKSQLLQQQLLLQQNTNGGPMTNLLNANCMTLQKTGCSTGGIVTGSVGHTLSPSIQTKKLSMSPTHIKALQQHVHQQQAARGSPLQYTSDFPISFLLDGSAQLPDQQTAEQIYLTTMQHKMLQLQQQQQHHQQQHHHQMQQQSIQQPQPQIQNSYALTPEQYPTPPSHGSQHISDSPPHQPSTFSSFQPDHLLTPSPGSPSHWSSSSPHSAHSDWSEGISSPAPAIAGLNPHRHKLITEQHAYF